MTSEQYKALSIQEFDRAAAKYDSGHAGVYELCKKDYPPVLEELEKEPFQTLLDCGCGTAPMLSLLTERWPERQYTGIDLSPKMLEAAQAKHIKNVTLVLGDCEHLVYHVLRPGGWLILRDMTGPNIFVKIMNRVEMPLVHPLGHGDVRGYTCAEVQRLCENAGLSPETVERRKGFRLHCVARKPALSAIKQVID